MIVTLHSQYHTKTLGSYWETERALVDKLYEHIHLPLERTQREVLDNVKEMSLDSFIGYLDTWSALKTYREKNPNAPDPLQQLSSKIYSALKLTSRDQTFDVSFPTVLILGQKLATH